MGVWGVGDYGDRYFGDVMDGALEMGWKQKRAVEYQDQIGHYTQLFTLSFPSRYSLDIAPVLLQLGTLSPPSLLFLIPQ